MRGPADRETLGLVAGFGIWSLAFVLLYGGHGLACSLGAGSDQGVPLARLLLIGIWLLFLALHALLVFVLTRRLRRAGPELHFVRSTSLILAIAALGATLWTGLPITSLRIC